MSGVTEITPGQKPAALPNGAGPKSGSLLDSVRAQLAADTAEEKLDLRLPRKQPRLAARYQVVDPDDAQGDDVDSANAWMLSQACTGLFLVDERGKLQPLDEDGAPVTYATVAQVLGFEAASAKEAILHLFKDNKLAFRDHADKVATWMTNTSLEVEGEVMGESSA